MKNAYKEKVNVIPSQESGNKKVYEPPRIEVIEVELEKGFADSSKGWEEEQTW